MITQDVTPEIEVQINALIEEINRLTEINTPEALAKAKDLFAERITLEFGYNLD